ncbi:MAG: CDP-diacylglycerol--glycerol-3-phosphate 3-phosphatidyltransferase [bacterium]
MSKIITLPNLITTLRIILSPIFVITMLLGGFYTIGALIIITIAAMTDFYDGKLARKYKSVSMLGTFLDPLADKILLSSVFLTFYVLKLIPLFPVLIIIFREFLITGLRVHSILTGKQIDTLHIGKIKTTIQFISIYLILFYVLIETFFKNQFLSNVSFGIAIASFTITVMITISSGIIYLIKNDDFFEFVSTCSYIGYFPVAPGTFASLVTTIILFFTELTPIYPKIIFVVILFIAGILTAEKISKVDKISDPQICGNR